VAFARSPELGNTMRSVANFSFSHGLLGQGARSADAVGIQLANGTVLGNRNNVKLRFVADYMALAAAGKL
jgi:NitT/TauT family transport system substrate-binding protein